MPALLFAAQAAPSASGVEAQAPLAPHSSAVQGLLSLHTTWPRHSPLTHTLAGVHAMPSSQFAPLAAAALCATPLGSLQPSMGQGLLSFVTSGLPAPPPVGRLAG